MIDKSRGSSVPGRNGIAPMNSSVIDNVSAVGNDLDITFKGGKTYRYSGAASHATALRGASSAGKYFRANILGQFDYAVQ